MRLKNSPSVAKFLPTELGSVTVSVQTHLLAVAMLL